MLPNEISGMGIRGIWGLWGIPPNRDMVIEMLSLEGGIYIYITRLLDLDNARVSIEDIFPIETIAHLLT